MSVHDRGFAALSPARRAEISSLGGKKAHALGHAHKWKSGREAEKAGRAGGIASAAKRKK